MIVALECPNTLAKKHMFELLTAVCVYSHLGHYRLLAALAHFKVSVPLSIDPILSVFQYAFQN